MTNEKEIFRKALNNQQNELLETLKLHQNALYRIAFRYLHNEHDALEALQELAYRSYVKIETLKDANLMKPWLIRILIHICLDMLRKRKREIPSEQMELGSYVEHTHLEIEVDELLGSLSLEQQELILLKYMEDMRNQDIALRLNIPEGTVKSRLHHALSKMKKWLQGEVL